jgi:hypothetical protein
VLPRSPQKHSLVNAGAPKHLRSDKVIVAVLLYQIVSARAIIQALFAAAFYYLAQISFRKVIDWKSIRKTGAFKKETVFSNKIRINNLPKLFYLFAESLLINVSSLPAAVLFYIGTIGPRSLVIVILFPISRRVPGMALNLKLKLKLWEDQTR